MDGFLQKIRNGKSIIMSIKVSYDDMKFHYITSHYDVHWRGTCIYNGKIAEFQTVDETDYDTMTDTCPYCKGDNYKTVHISKCHCKVYPELFCMITEIPLLQRIQWMLKKIYYKKIYHPSFAY